MHSALLKTAKDLQTEKNVVLLSTRSGVQFCHLTLGSVEMTPLTEKPLQVNLREEQLDALRCLSETKQISLEELARQAVDLLLAKTSVQKDPLWDFVGLGASNVGNIAEAHDQYLAESETGC